MTNPFLQVTEPEPTARPQGNPFLQVTEPTTPARVDTTEPGVISNTLRGVGERASQIAGNTLRFVGTTAEELGDWLEARVPLGRIEIGAEGISWRKYTPAELAEDQLAPIHEAAKALENVDLGYTERTTWEDVKARPLSNFIPFALEQGIVSAPDMAAVLYTLPAYVASRVAGIGQQRAENEGRTDATVEDFIKTAPAAVASAALERLGTRGVLGLDDIVRVWKDIPGAAIKAGAKEGLTEAGQNVIEYAGATVGTPGGFQPAEAADQALQGAVAGTPFGGITRGAVGAIEALRGSPDVDAPPPAKDLHDLIAGNEARVPSPVADTPPEQTPPPPAAPPTVPAGGTPPEGPKPGGVPGEQTEINPPSTSRLRLEDLPTTGMIAGTPGIIGSPEATKLARQALQNRQLAERAKAAGNLEAEKTFRRIAETTLREAEAAGFRLEQKAGLPPKAAKPTAPTPAGEVVTPPTSAAPVAPAWQTVDNGRAKYVDDTTTLHVFPLGRKYIGVVRRAGSEPLITDRSFDTLDEAQAEIDRIWQQGVKPPKAKTSINKYEVVDGSGSATNAVVATYNTPQAARAEAERLNKAAGMARYSVKPTDRQRTAGAPPNMLTETVAETGANAATLVAHQLGATNNRYSFEHTPIYDELKASGKKLLVRGDPNLASMVERFLAPLMKRLTPNLELVVDLDPNSLQARPGHFGNFRGFGGGLGSIWISPRMQANPVLLYTTLAHEFGHAIMTERFATAGTATQQAIYAEFHNQVKKHFGKGSTATAADFITDLYSAPNLIMFNGHLTDPTMSSKEFMTAYTNVNDWYSFDEWMAEQVAKWMTTAARPVNLADRVFKGMATKIKEALKMAWNVIKRSGNPQMKDFEPVEAVKLWLESMLNNRPDVPVSLIAARAAYQQGMRENAEALGLSEMRDVTGYRRFMPKELRPTHEALQWSLSTGAGKLSQKAAAVIQTVKDEFQREFGREPNFHEISTILTGELEASGATGDGVYAMANVTTPQSAIQHVAATAANTGIPRRTLAQVDNYIDKLRFWPNLLQLAWKNPHIQGLQHYVEIVRQWHIDKMAWVSRGDGRIKEWRKLGKDMGDRLSKFLFDVDAMTYLPNGQNVRWPTVQEIITLAQKHGLNRSAIDVYTQIKGDFLAVLDAIEKAWVKDAQRSFSDPAILAREIFNIQTEMATLRSRPYFPHERFGDWTVTVWDPKGKVVHYETTESAKEADRLAAVLRGQPQFAGHRVGAGKLAEEVKIFRGLPPSLIKNLASRMKGLTQAQVDQLDQIIFSMSPANTFAKKFARRKGTPGYSQDAMRSYANYFLHAGGHIARVQWQHDLDDATKSVYESAKQMQGTHTAAAVGKRVGIADYMARHLQYIMNPGSEWSALRSLAFFWHLGFNASSALVNLTQLPMSTYPYLAARFNDFKAVHHMRKATTDLHKLLTLSAKLPQDEVDATRKGIEMGFLDESMATDLAGASQYGVLGRIIPGSAIERGRQKLAYASAFLFQTAEKINRRVAFTAAYRLAKSDPTNSHVQEVIAANQLLYKDLLAQGWTPSNAGAFIFGRDAIDRTMFNYSAYARPEFVRGRKGAVFAFWMFKQNMLYFYKNDPGAVRALMILGATAGLMGLPFADDLLQLIKYGSRLFGSDFDAEKEARQLIIELAGDDDTGRRTAETLMMGLGKESFGMTWAGEMLGVPIPGFDISSRLSMGSIIPGLQPLLQGAAGEIKPEESIGRAGMEAVGASYGIPLTILRGLESGNLDDLKAWERLLPTAAKNAVRALRYFTQGQEVNNTGAEVLDFDVTDTRQAAEILGQAIGLTPTRLSRKWDMQAMQRDAVRYWVIQRSMLFDEFDKARRTKDREALADARAAVRKFNREAPDKRLRISASDLIGSARQRDKNRKLIEQGSALQKTYEGVSREVRSLIPSD